MLRLCCPICRKPYTISQLNIPKAAEDVNVCLFCGWLSSPVEDPCEVYFSEEYLATVRHLVTETIQAAGWINTIDQGVFQTAFGDCLSWSHGALLMRSHVGFNVPYKCLHYFTKVLEPRHRVWRGLDPEIRNHRGFCVLSGAYEVPVLWATGSMRLAVILRYASCALGERPANILLAPYLNTRMSQLLDLVSPSRVITVGYSPAAASVLQSFWPVPFYIHTEPDLPEPVTCSMRAIEEKIANAPAPSPGNYTSQCTVDSDGLGHTLTRLGIPENVPVEPRVGLPFV